MMAIQSPAGAFGQLDAVPERDSQHNAYLSELLSYSLERLNKEPELLRADADRVRRQMQEVAVSHYRAFITAADAVQSIQSELASIDGHLNSLVDELPELTSGCNKFLEEAQHVVEKRKLNRTMLSNHGTLLDLLEIPQLMDTCVRNGNYDEALDLEAFVSKLATMHAKLPVIQSLAEEVRATTQSMLSQLLQRLRSSIQLPECLRVIGYLRRLAVFSEHDMRLQFLRCREAWLADILADLDSTNSYDYLKRMTDLHRVHLFDVVMQYRAIFADDTSGQEETSDGGLVYSWAMHRVTSFLDVLRTVLPKVIDGGSLASVLEQCMYCGMSLGRVGLDFRGLLPPLFESCVFDLFVRNVTLAVDTFQHVLDTHKWVPLPALGAAARISGRDQEPNDLAPPYSLMEHPPLAAFVNGVLGALNELRHCAPLALKSQVAAALQAGLQSVADGLLRYNAARVLKDSESALFTAMCKAFLEVACPYCVLCFGRCYAGGSSLIDTRSLSEQVHKLIAVAAHVPEENGLSKGRSRASSLDASSLPKGSRARPRSRAASNASSELRGVSESVVGVVSNGHDSGATSRRASETRSRTSEDGNQAKDEGEEGSRGVEASEEALQSSSGQEPLAAITSTASPT